MLLYEYLMNAFICIIGFIIFIVIYPLIALLVMWLIGKISPKWKMSIRKRLCIALIPNTIIYLLAVGEVYVSDYIYTGVNSLGNAYDISLPFNYASNIEKWQRSDDYGEVQYIKFIGEISDKAIARMDALCDETSEAVRSSKDIICHYPIPNNSQSEQMGINPKKMPRGWRKEGDIYYYSSENGSYNYYFIIDVASNTAVAELYKW